MKDKIELAIVDDDTIVVQLLGKYLKEKGDVIIWSTANCGNDFIKQLEKNNTLPDVVLLDLKMKNGEGIEVMDILRVTYPTIKIIVLSSYYKPSFSGHLLQLGANAFLSKETDLDELVTIVEKVMQDGNYLSADQVAILRQQVSNRVEKVVVFGNNKLSKRELEVLALICQQYTGKQIAQKLFISVKTVETHKTNLLVKTGCKNTAGLIVFAAQQRLVDLDQLVMIG